jgi:RNA polymerase sigma factor (sigma-70 family)
VQSDEGYNAAHMRAEAIPASPLAARLPRSKRLLALAGDERLVQQIRAGSEAAFEVAFERHGPAILSFCRHMLGSVQEAEDAVQHTFASAYRTLLQDERPIRLKPWLFTIARNRSLSVLRARREPAAELHDIPTAGLSGQVEQRAELRDLLSDLHDLPDEQRAALLLAEVSDLSHAEVAEAIGCEVNRVKALVFRARSGLIERREARETPCDEIRVQLANLRGGSLRRGELRHHLRVCPGCRDYREQVKRQRRLLGAALPVTPSLGLKSSVLSALGLGGGSAGGGGALAGSLGLASAAPVGASVAKVAALAVLVTGGAVAGERALVPARLPDSAPTHAAQPAPASARHAAPRSAPPGAGAAPKSGVRRNDDAAARGRRRAHGNAVGKEPKAHEHPAAGSGRGKAAAQPPARTPQARSPRSASGRAQRGRSAPKHEPITRTRAPRKAHAESNLRPAPSQQPPGKTDRLTPEGG